MQNENHYTIDLNIFNCLTIVTFLAVVLISTSGSFGMYT